MIPTIFIGQQRSVPPPEKLSVRHSVNVPFWICVLAICERFVKDLVFPHVEVQDHDDEDDTIVKPFSCNININRFSSAARGKSNIEGV